jgi:pyruvate ferredoxin oxidoreductase alpha subunit
VALESTSGGHDEGQEVIKRSTRSTVSSSASYGDGLLEEYRTGRRRRRVAMGTLTSTSRAAVDKMRKEGKRIGLVKLKSYRPFPDEEFREIAKRIHTIGVIDRNISLGENGIAYGSIRSAVYDMMDRPKVLGYYAGLAGREVRVRDIEKAAEKTLKGDDEAPTWIG